MGKKKTKSSKTRAEKTVTDIQTLGRRTKRIKPLDMAEIYIRKRIDPDGFKERYIDDFIGRGVFAERNFQQGEFLLEYAGTLIYGDMPDTDYTYHSQHKGKNFCIDATEEPLSGPKLCRLVNHGDKKADRNAYMKMVAVDDNPHLCLFSLRHILKGEEIRYNYGVKDLPWQKSKKDQYMEPVNHSGIAEKQCTDETNLQTNSQEQAEILDFDMETENHGNFEIQVTDENNSPTNSLVPAETLDQDLEPVNHSGIAEKQCSDETNLQTNSQEQAEILDFDMETENHDNFEIQVTDENNSPTNSLVPAETLDQDMEPVNQASIAETQCTDETNLQTNSQAQAEILPTERQRPYREKQRGTVHADWHADSDDMYVSDDSFNDPPYFPPKENEYSSDDGSDSQTKQAEILTYLKLKKKQREHQTNPIARKDVDNNSDSDPSEASEIYPLVTNVKSTEKKDLSLIYENEHLSEDDEYDNLSMNAETKEMLNDDKIEETDGVNVAGTTSYVDGRRVVDKKQCCVFCGKLDYRLPRHYQRHHGDHPAVIALQSKTEKERDREFDRLRLEGAYQHNIKVLTENKGTLILQRRPSKADEMKYSYEDYLHCEYCKGFYLKTNLWKHQKKCQFKPRETTEGSKGKKRRAQRNSVLLMETVLPTNKSFKPGFIKNIISTLHVDDVSNIIKRDDVIMRVGDFMYDKHAKSQRDYISQELRLLGRLVLSLREELKNSNGYLKDFLRPRNFDGIVESARNLSKKEETEDNLVLRKYSVALKCGPSLNKCCVILKGIARRNSDDEGEKEAQRLQDLITDEWSGKVTSVALRSRKEIKRNEVILLPTPGDLSKLKDHIDNEISETYTILKDNNDNSEQFQKLQAAILCRIIMFNRRRSGETSKILLKDYLMRPDWRQSINDEIYQSLGSVEKQLIKRLDMIALRGKRGRPVTIIVTPEIKAGLDLLVRCRPFHIEIDNPFLFARGSGMNNIRGSDHMTKFANKAGLQFPERIGSTSMRKYIATVVQVLNLNEAELEWLANHLGHSIEVHKEFYRNQGAAIQLGKVAKTLIAMDQGRTLSSLQQEDVPDEIVTEGLSDEEDVEMPDDDNTEVQAEPIFETFSTECVVAEQKKGSTVKPWSNEEMAAIKRTLQGHINIMKCPGKKDCEEAIAKEPALNNRDWTSIKFKVAYLIKRKKEALSKTTEKKKNRNVVKKKILHK